MSAKIDAIIDYNSSNGEDEYVVSLGEYSTVRSQIESGNVPIVLLRSLVTNELDDETAIAATVTFLVCQSSTETDGITLIYMNGFSSTRLLWDETGIAEEQGGGGR